MFTAFTFPTLSTVFTCLFCTGHIIRFMSYTSNQISPCDQLFVTSTFLISVFCSKIFTSPPQPISRWSSMSPSVHNPSSRVPMKTFGFRYECTMSVSTRPIFVFNGGTFKIISMLVLRLLWHASNAGNDPNNCNLKLSKANQHIYYCLTAMCL